MNCLLRRAPSRSQCRELTPLARHVAPQHALDPEPARKGQRLRGVVESDAEGSPLVRQGRAACARKRLERLAFKRSSSGVGTVMDNACAGPEPRLNPGRGALQT